MKALRSALAFAALATLSSCAPAVHEPAGLPPAPPAATTPVPAPSSPAAPAGGATFAAPDTVPSPAALAVLATIPEPVGENAPSGKGGRKPSAPRPDAVKPAEPVKTPDRAPEGVGTPAPPEMADSLQVAQAPPTDAPAGGADTASVPVPAPTKPLGVAPVTPAPTPEPPASAPPVASAPPAPAVEEPTTAPADTCWRVQVGASSQRAKASRLRAAAESQLLMRMVVEKERNLWKVRTQDCVSRTTAESLKSRAMATGFQGVFLVRYVKRP